jgi:hypothetical protein
MDIQEFMEMLPLLAPVFLVWFILLVVALRDLVRRQSTRGPRWVWFLVVICFSILGPVAYFLLGREE